MVNFNIAAMELDCSRCNANMLLIDNVVTFNNICNIQSINATLLFANVHTYNVTEYINNISVTIDRNCDCNLQL